MKKKAQVRQQKMEGTTMVYSCETCTPIIAAHGSFASTAVMFSVREENQTSLISAIQKCSANVEFRKANAYIVVEVLVNITSSSHHGAVGDSSEPHFENETPMRSDNMA